MISIEQRSQELAFKLQTTEKKVDRLETEIDRLQSLEIELHELKRDLLSSTKETQNNKNILVSTENAIEKTTMFVKELYKNYTVISTLIDKHNACIQYLYNYTESMNESLVKVYKEVDDTKSDISVSLMKHVDNMESCQSGDNVELGSHNIPARS